MILLYLARAHNLNELFSNVKKRYEVCHVRRWILVETNLREVISWLAEMRGYLVRHV